MSNKYVLLLMIVLGSIVVDQWSKQMAVRYLRAPSDRDFRTEHYQPCTKQRKQCEKLCRAKAHDAKISLVACKRVCKRQETQCRDRLTPAYERAKLAWKKDVLPALQSSFMCRKIKFPNASRPECVVIKGYFHFTYRTNPGAAWGIFSTLDDSVRRPFFICITMIAILFIFYLFVFRLESDHKLMIIALALILGGALGNFMDRLRLDYVVDFIEWFWRNRAGMSWPTFNIADAAISIGVGLIAIELFFFPQEEWDEDEEGSDAKDGGNEVTLDAVATSEATASTNENATAATTDADGPTAVASTGTGFDVAQPADDAKASGEDGAHASAGDATDAVSDAAASAAAQGASEAPESPSSETVGETAVAKPDTSDDENT